MSVLGASFALLLILGVPIAYTLGIAGVAGLLALDFDLVTVPLRMFASTDSFVLLAAPFFILVGDVMARGGITDRLIYLSSVIVGRVRAGTAYANIVASVLFAGISGTAIADAAALGQVFIKGMPKEGYPLRFSAALTIASALIGPIIPPSLIMVIYAIIARVSVLDLFLAGIIPGLLLGGACAVVVWLYGRGGRLPKAEITIKRSEITGLALDGVLVASLPLFIVLGTLSGVFTPTEAGGIAVVYAILLGMVVYRHLSFGGLWDALKNSIRITATLYLVMDTTEVVSTVFAFSGMQVLTDFLVGMFEGQPVMFMLALVAILLVMGSAIDNGIQTIVFLPLLMPSVRAMGVDDMQFAMIFILAGNLSLITPPVGIILFVACRIGNIPVWSMFKAVFPFLIAEALVIVILILVPELSTALPSLRH